MKKKILIFLILFSQLLFFSKITYADDINIKVFVNNQQIQFDVSPFITNDRVLVPLRAILEALSAEVEWDESAQTVFAKKANKAIIIKIDSKIASVDGKEVLIDVPATIIDGRTFVPLRFIGESLGAVVNWDESAKIININSIPLGQNAAANSAVFFKKEATNNFSLINNRLFVKMPDGAKEEDIQHGIMAPNSSNEEESKIVLEENGNKLVVYAKETFFYSSGNIEEDGRKLLNLDDKSKKMNYSLKTLKSDKDISVIEVIPDQYNAENNSVLVRGALVKNTDNTLISISIYVTNETFKDKDNCIQLSDTILNTIKAGTRKLNILEHKEKFEGNLEISLTNDYVLIQKNGIDFTVYYISKIVPVGNVQPYMGIYFGAHPSPFILGNEERKDKSTKINGNLMGKKFEWIYYNPAANVVDSDSIMETIFSIGEDGYYKMHMFILPTIDKDMNEMKGIAESLKYIK